MARVETKAKKKPSKSMSDKPSDGEATCCCGCVWLFLGLPCCLTGHRMCYLDALETPGSRIITMNWCGIGWCMDACAISALVDENNLKKKLAISMAGGNNGTTNNNNNNNVIVINQAAPAAAPQPMYAPQPYPYGPPPPGMYPQQGMYPAPPPQQSYAPPPQQMMQATAPAPAYGNAGVPYQALP